MVPTNTKNMPSRTESDFRTTEPIFETNTFTFGDGKHYDFFLSIKKKKVSSRWTKGSTTFDRSPRFHNAITRADDVDVEDAGVHPRTAP